jgi:hypothetical protein
VKIPEITKSAKERKPFFLLGSYSKRIYYYKCPKLLNFLVYQATVVCATASSLGTKTPRIDAVAMMKSTMMKSKMIQEYYRQMRKFGCNILAVVQRYDISKDSGRKKRDDR